MSHDVIQVVTTTENKDDALKIAHLLVERRLAACVQVVGPVTSVFRWKGVVEQAQEWQCWGKTTTSRYASVEAAIREHHPYDEPEILAMPVVAGSASYLTWLAEEVGEE